MQSLTAVGTLRRRRIAYRWFFSSFTVIGLTLLSWLQLTRHDSVPIFYPFLLLSAAFGSLLRRHFTRLFRADAPGLMVEAYHSRRPGPLVVARSWSDAVDLACLALWLTVSGIVTWIRPRPTLTGGMLYGTLAVTAVIMVLILAWALTRGRPGRTLLELDATGVRLTQSKVSLEWAEIDYVYCLTPVDRLPGLALHIADSSTTASRLGRWQRRLLKRRDGWLCIDESTMRTDLTEVMAAAVSLHRAATEEILAV